MKLQEEVIDVLNHWFKGIKDNDFQGMYLFGSLVNDTGRGFRRTKSDVDIILEFKLSSVSALERKDAIVRISKQIEFLEYSLAKLFDRDNTLQITSVIPVTQFEIDFNIHKDINGKFFSKGPFINSLSGKNHNFSTKNFLLEDKFLELSNSIKYCQEIRNKFLKINMYGKGIMESFTDIEDRLPKKLLRCAGRITELLEPNLSNESTQSEGLSCIKDELKRQFIKTNNVVYKELRELLTIQYDKDVFKVEPIDILLIVEILFDQIANIISEGNNTNNGSIIRENTTEEIEKVRRHIEKGKKIYEITPGKQKRDNKNFLFQTNSFILQSKVPYSIKKLEEMIRIKPDDFLPKENIENLVKNHSYVYIYFTSKYNKLEAITKRIKELKENYYENNEQIYKLLKSDLNDEVGDLRKIQEIIRDVEALILKEKLDDIEKAKQEYCRLFLLEDNTLSVDIERNISKAIANLLTRIGDIKKFMKEIIILGNNHYN